MWIYMSEAFFSIVAHNAATGVLIVRARVRGDIERVFGAVPITESYEWDYRYRAFLSRHDVADAIAQRIVDLPYPDVKGSVEDPVRKAVYTQVWNATHGLAAVDDPLAHALVPVGEDWAMGGEDWGEAAEAMGLSAADLFDPEGPVGGPRGRGGVS